MRLAGRWRGGHEAARASRVPAGRGPLVCLDRMAGRQRVGEVAGRRFWGQPGATQPGLAIIVRPRALVPGFLACLK
jgi:hypothetical protein